MKSNILISFFLLVYISLGYVATDIYLPSLPVLTDYFQTSDTMTQLTVFSYLLSFAFMPLFFGPLSDFLGRKKVMLIGTLITLVATAGCLVSTTIVLLIAFRFIQGIGTGAVVIAVRAMIPDLFSGKQLARQISFITMLFPITLALAPSIGGVLQQMFGWRAVFLFLLLYLILILLGLVFVEESLQVHKRKHIREMVASYKAVLTNVPFLLFGMGMVLPTIGMFAYLTASPYLFQEIVGLSPSEYGFLAIYIGAGICFSSFLNVNLLNYLSINTLLLIGSLMMISSGVLMFAFYEFGWVNTWAILLPSVIYFSCIPFSSSNSISKAMGQIHENFGTATALLTTFQFLGGALGSLVISFLPENSPLPLASFYLLAGIISLLNLYRNTLKHWFLTVSDSH